MAVTLEPDFWHDGVIGEARLDHLVILHREGCSLGLMAERLGTTRNAISGKCQRMHLPLLPKPVQTKVHPNILRHHQRASIKRSPPVNGRTPPPPGEHRCTLLGLTNRSCRYPLWGDGSLSLDEKFYCGVPQADAHSGRPYCVMHARRCLTAPKAKGKNAQG